MNPLRGACSLPANCFASAGSTQLEDSTDQDPYTGAYIQLPKGAPAGAQAAFVQARLPAAAGVTRVSVRGFGDAPIDLILIKVRG